MTPPVTWLGPAAANWLAERNTPYEQLVTFGPAGFGASARVRFIPDPLWPGQEEADVVVAFDHAPDLVQAQRALRRLSHFTATPDTCYFCIWEGYSDIVLPRHVVESALVVLPHRRYAMFQAAISRIESFAEDFGSGRTVAPPAFIWPADRQWCFACDVDPHWAGVGADQAAVDALLADPDLDVVQVEPDQPQPRYH